MPCVCAAVPAVLREREERGNLKQAAFGGPLQAPEVRNSEGQEVLDNHMQETPRLVRQTGDQGLVALHRGLLQLAA